MCKNLLRSCGLALCLAFGAGMATAQGQTADGAAHEAAVSVNSNSPQSGFAEAAGSAGSPAVFVAPRATDSAASGVASGQTGETQQLSINELRQRRGLTDPNNIFVPKGQWVFGGSASYSTHTNNRYQFLIIEDIDSKGYTFRVSPMIGYAVKDNMVVGARFIYSRALLKLNNAHLTFGDDEDATELTANNFYTLTHNFSAAIIWRQYIPLGNSKRFAIFNEVQLTGGGSQAKFANDSPVKGTYQTGYHFSLGLAPGIVAFATNNMAVEVNVGVMGISYSHFDQVHNRVKEGSLDTSKMNFKINLFSIGLGLAFYL